MPDNEVKVIMTMVDKMTPTAKNMQRSLGDMGKDFLKTTGLAIGLGGAVMGAAKFFKSTVDETVAYAKSVRDLGRALGVGTEEASKLIQVADDLMIPLGSLELGFKSALRQGIAPTIDGLKGLAVEYQALPPGAAQAQFALEKFGRAGLEMQKILELAPETIDEMAQSAEDAGLVMSEQSAQAARDYEIAMDGLSDSVSGLKQEIGEGLIPALADATEGLTGFFSRIHESRNANDMLTFALDKGTISVGEYAVKWAALHTPLGDAEKIITELTPELELLNEEIERAGEGTNRGAGGWDSYTEAIDTAAPSMEEINNQLLTMGINAGEAARQIEFADVAIRGMSEAMVEEERIRFVLEQIQIRNSDLTEEEKNRLLEQNQAEFDLAMRIQDVTAAREAGNISWGQWATLMADGKITLSEYNELFGTTVMKVGELNSGLQIMGGQINGLPSQKTVNIDIIYTTLGQPPIIQGGQFVIPAGPGGQHGLDMIVPEGFENDTYPIRASSGERVIIQPRNTYNFTLNQHTSAPGSTVVRDFMMMKGMSRL